MLSFLRSNLTLLIFGMVAIVGVTYTSVIQAPPFADEQFIYYKVFAEADNPLESALNEALPLIRVGTFRPVTRAIYGAEFWIEYAISDTFNVPMYVIAGIFSYIFVFINLFLIIFLIDQYGSVNRNSFFWKRLSILFVIFYCCFLVLRNPGQHPMLLFPSLYLGASIVTFFVAGYIGQCFLKKKLFTLFSSNALFLIFLGVLVSGLIELGYFAVPFAGMHIATLWVMKSRSLNISQFLKSDVIKSYSLFVFAFLIIFVPVRIKITQICSLQDCYSPSNIVVNSESFTIAVERSLSVFNTFADSLSIKSAFSFSEGGLFFLIATVIAILIYFQKISLDSGTRDKLPISSIGLLFLTWGVLLLLAGLMGGVSEKVQSIGGFSTAWRDTTYIWPASAFLVALGINFIIIRLKSGLFKACVCILVVFMLPTFNVNSRISAKIVAAPINKTHKELNSLAMKGDADSTNDERCDLISHLHKYGPKNSNKNTIAALNEIHLKKEGHSFCEEEK